MTDEELAKAVNLPVDSHRVELSRKMRERAR
jgi:hypothetical protein